jgi:hypothetical protein
MRGRTGTGFVALLVGGALWTVWPPAVAAQSPLDDAFAVLEEGNVEEGRNALLQVAADLAPSQSVGLVRLVRMLDRLGEAHGERGARAAGMAHAGRLDEAIGLLEAGRAGAEEAHGSALLSLAARLADDANEAAMAAELRDRLVTTYPTASDRAEAILALARYRRETGERTEEMAALLEELIVAQPNHALVPAARRELERLRPRGG